MKQFELEAINTELPRFLFHAEKTLYVAFEVTEAA